MLKICFQDSTIIASGNHITEFFSNLLNRNYEFIRIQMQDGKSLFYFSTVHFASRKHWDNCVFQCVFAALSNRGCFGFTIHVYCSNCKKKKKKNTRNGLPGLFVQKGKYGFNSTFEFLMYVHIGFLFSEQSLLVLIWPFSLVRPIKIAQLYLERVCSV